MIIFTVILKIRQAIVEFTMTTIPRDRRGWQPEIRTRRRECGRPFGDRESHPPVLIVVPQEKGGLSSVG